MTTCSVRVPVPPLAASEGRASTTNHRRLRPHRPMSSAIQSSQGTLPARGAVLFHRRVVPAGRPSAVRLALLHGYGEHSGRHRPAMEWLAARGVHCEAIDFRGHGFSTGVRGGILAWEDYLDDVRALLDSPALTGEGPPLVLLGHSHGGLVAAAAVLHTDLGERLSGLVLTSPYFRSRVPVAAPKALLARVLSPVLPGFQFPSNLKREWMTHDPAMIEDSRADPLLTRVATPRWFVTMRQAQKRVLMSAAGLRVPLLMMAAGADPVADTDAAREFFDRVAGEKEWRFYPEGRHELLRETVRERVYQDLLDWLLRHVGTEPV